jgi:hypothetical protein
MEKDKKTEIFNKLKSASRTPVKFRNQKVDNKYVIVFNTPFPLKITNIGNFSKLFNLNKLLDKTAPFHPTLNMYRKVFKKF